MEFDESYAEVAKARSTMIWSGYIDWEEKDSTNPGSQKKVRKTTKASLIAKDTDDALNKAEVKAVETCAQNWPWKIYLQLISKQLIELMSAYCSSSVCSFELKIKGDDSDLKNALLTKDGILNLASFNPRSSRYKLIILQRQGDKIMCKIPDKQDNMISFLKKLVLQQRRLGLKLNLSSPMVKANPFQARKEKLWNGSVEWEDNRVKQDNQINTAEASITPFEDFDQITGQYSPEVPDINNKIKWSNKMRIHLLSKTVLDLLSSTLYSAKSYLLEINGDNQDLKNALSIGGGLIHLQNNASDIRVVLAVCQGNDIVLKIPSDQD